MSTLGDIFQVFRKVDPFLQEKEGQLFPPESGFREEWESRMNKVGEQILRDNGKPFFEDIPWDTPLTPTAEVLFQELKAWVRKENPMLADWLKI